MVWKEAKDGQGRVYYYNDKGQTSWEKPEELFNELERRLLKHGWKSATTDDGKVYYYNLSTRETTWNLPVDFEKEATNESPIREPVRTAVKSGDLASPKAIHDQDAAVVELQNQKDSKYKNKSELLVAKKAINKSEAEKSFLQMLSEYGVDSTWSFNRIIREIGSKDARYWIIDDDPLWKQTTFDKFLSNRTESELLKEHEHLEKFEQAFTEMLEKLPDIHYYSRWPTVKRRIRNEPIYKHSVVDEKIKRQTFMRFIGKLQRQNETAREKVRSDAMRELHQYFDTISDDIDPITLPWNKFSAKYLWQSPRFESNKKFKILTQVDVFNEYLSFVTVKYSSLKNDIESLRSKNFTADRRARDDYRKLLEEISPPIRYNTTWKDFYPLVRRDARFLSMLGRTGSSALDIFLDKVEEASLIMKAKCSVANQVLVSNGLDPENSSPDEIRKALLDSGQFSEVLSEHIDAIIQTVKENTLRKKEEHLRREMEHHIMSTESRAFEEKVGSIARSARLSQWEDVYPLIKDEPTFLRLPDGIGRLIFDSLKHKGSLTRKRALEVTKSAADLDY